MNRADIRLVTEVDVKHITLMVSVIGSFWGGFLGSIAGYILSGVLGRGVDLIVQGGFIGTMVGLGLGFGSFVMAISYNLLASWGGGLKIKTQTLSPSGEPNQTLKISDLAREI